MKKKFSLIVVLFIIGIIVAATISTSAFREAYRSRRIQKEVDDLKAQAQQIQRENDALKQRIAYFQTPEFQEKVAKEKLNLQKPDENIVIVKPTVSELSETEEEEPQVIELKSELPNYLKWWNLFFKY